MTLKASLIALIALVSLTDVQAVVLENAQSISVPNVIGVHKLTSDRDYTPIAVCFGETAVEANLPTNVVRHATNLVFTANLQADDQLFVYDHDRKAYAAYTLKADKTWEPTKVFSATSPTNDVPPTANQSQPWGYGFWVYRKDAAKRADQTIWLAGQVPINTVSISLAPSTADSFGKTLVGNPLGEVWNLNDTKIIDWSSVAAENDHIQLNDANATLYYWKKNKTSGNFEWRKMSGTGDGTIPAGAAFWFVRAKPKTSGAKVASSADPITITFRTGL